MYVSLHTTIKLIIAMKHVCTYILAPSCYVTTNCIGEPINSSTYSDCCMNYGVSYDLDGQCQPCPSTRKCTASTLHKLLFVCILLVVTTHAFGVHTTEYH